MLGACVALTMFAAACGGTSAPADSGTDAGTDAGPDLCADVVCSALSSCHEVGTCDPATGECSSPVRADGAACDDGAACTTDDACLDGVCVGGEPAADGTHCPCGACFGGECGLRSLGATGLEPGDPTPRSLAVDETRVYVGNQYAGYALRSSVTSLPVAGGAPTTLASGFSGIPLVAVLDGTVYYTRNAEVWSVPADGSAAGAPLFINAAQFASMTSDGARLYLTTGTSGDSIVSVELTGEGTTLATSEATPGPIATDGTRLYWINYDDGTIRAMPVAGGTPVTIATGTAPRNLAVDSTHVYWTEPTTGEVLRAPLEGGATTPLATAQPEPSGIMVFGGRVYWTNYNGGMAGAVMAVDAARGGIATVPGALLGPALLAHNGECIYVLHDGVVSSAPAF